MHHVALYVLFILLGLLLLEGGPLIARIVRARSSTRAFVPQFSNTLRSGNIEGAKRIAEGYQTSYIARVALTGLKELLETQDIQYPEIRLKRVDRGMARAIEVVIVELKQGLPSVEMVAASQLS